MILRHFKNHTTLNIIIFTFILCTPVLTKAIVLEAKILEGEWIRPDGGYVLKINQILPDKIDAGYFNPRNIKIEHAGVSIWKGLLKLDINFADTGYEGSYYTLYYYKEKDALAGFYYQASLDRTFEVVFIRKSTSHN